MLVLNLPAFENKKYIADDRFHGNGSYGEILTKKEPIRTLGFTCNIIEEYKNLKNIFNQQASNTGNKKNRNER